MDDRDLLSTSDAARQLGVQPSRVRALLEAGELRGFKLGERWAVQAESIRERRAGFAPAGRLLEPANAWAVLALASGDSAPALTADARWRLRRLLNKQGLAGLAPRMRRRAHRERYQAHPGVLAPLSQLPELVRTGISAAAAHGLDLAGGNELDAYVSPLSRDELVRAYALEPVRAGGNVSLRVLLDGLWPFVAHQAVAPLAAVALDLSEDADSRSLRAGDEALAVLDRERRWAPPKAAARTPRRA